MVERILGTRESPRLHRTHGNGMDLVEAERQDVQSYRVFSEPVTVVSWADPDPLNQSLARLILAQEKRGQGLKRSNQGGWHSRQTFFKSSSPEIGELKRRIAVALKIRTRRGGLHGWRLSGWANVSRRGHWNALHYHGKAVWSGIYYVQVGSDSRPPEAPGHLVLYDLRQLKKWDGKGGLPADTRTHRILPVPGRMILFPGQLWHGTDVYSGPGARVSVAFNLS